MKPDPSSLDRLHDLVLPPAVPWWPPAPGWYVVLALLIFFAAWLAWRFSKSWRANSYRRAALRELPRLRDAPAIAELLRRTALAIAPRSVIAEKTGTAWLDWLAAQCHETMPEAVGKHFTAWVYGRSTADHELSSLRDYAARWIARHRVVSPDGRRPD
jgi:hypothetical protein